MYTSGFCWYLSLQRTPVCPCCIQTPCILIFDPKVDLFRVILLYCVRCVKEQPVMRIILNNHNPQVLQTKIADLDEARILRHRFHTNFFMI
jgi:hypothetical protein